MKLTQRNTDVSTNAAFQEPLQQKPKAKVHAPDLPPLFDLVEQEDCYLIAVDLPGFPDPRMELDAKIGKLQVVQPASSEEAEDHVLFRCTSLGNQVRAVYFQGALWLMLPKKPLRPQFENLSGLEEAAQLAETSATA